MGRRRRFWLARESCCILEICVCVLRNKLSEAACRFDVCEKKQKTKKSIGRNAHVPFVEVWGQPLSCVVVPRCVRRVPHLQVKFSGVKKQFTVPVSRSKRKTPSSAVVASDKRWFFHGKSAHHDHHGKVVRPRGESDGFRCTHIMGAWARSDKSDRSNTVRSGARTSVSFQPTSDPKTFRRNRICKTFWLTLPFLGQFAIC